MNLPILSMLFFFLVHSAGALTLEELQVSWKNRTLKIDETRKSSLEGLQGKYAKALAPIKQAYQEAGALEEALAIESEIKSARAGEWPLPPLPKSVLKKMERPRKIYETARAKIDLKWAHSYNQASETMVEALTQQQLNLTKSGELKLAKKVQESLEALEKDPLVVRARELPLRMTASGKPKSAMVLRRNGDDLEVMVMYDREGKVSMASPVKNVIERTGGQRERGQTKAKTLGEFLGGTGPAMERFVSYDWEVSKGTPKDLIGSQVKVGSPADVEGERAVALTLVDNVSNPYTTLNGVLPGLDSPAAVQLSLRYFIPRDNKMVMGITLQHGPASDGKLIGNHQIEKGKWVDARVEGVSGSSTDLLRLYHRGVPQKDPARAGGDRFYLASLKIEFLRYSAFVVEAFSPSGASGGAVTKADQQKLFAKNGVIESP